MVWHINYQFKTALLFANFLHLRHAPLANVTREANFDALRKTKDTA